MLYICSLSEYKLSKVYYHEYLDLIRTAMTVSACTVLYVQQDEKAEASKQKLRKGKMQLNCLQRTHWKSVKQRKIKFDFQG